MAFLDQTIDWANYADSSDKIAFLKVFVGSLGNEELNCLRGVLSRKRKRSFNFVEPSRPWKGPRLFTGCTPSTVRNPPRSVIPPAVQQQPSVINPSDRAPPPAVHHQPSTGTPPANEQQASVRNPSISVIPPEVQLQHSTTVPSSSVTPPADTKKPAKVEAREFWYEKYPAENFVAFDVEAASRYLCYLDNGRMPKDDETLPPGKSIKEDEPRIPKAAYVSVVNHQLQPVMEEKVKHSPGTFRVDYFSKTTANISSTQQLKDGKPFPKVIEQFNEISKNKFHITCGGGCDYSYLELPPSEYLRFDLQSFYQRPSDEDPNKMEPMSLRDIYFYHFGEDFQRGPHDATVDAKATMKIFMEGYQKLDIDQEVDFSEVPKLKKLAKKNLLWCRNEKKFMSPCKCVECKNVVV